MLAFAMAAAAVSMMQAPQGIYNYDGGPNAMPLWSGKAPGALGTEKVDIPSITRFDPPAGKATGAAIVVCPGGGYGFLASHEGPDTAEWLAKQGVTAFVLKYRLGPKYHHPVELGDAQRAIRTVRAHAAEWKLDPNKIGIMGFSAGGHLASTAATHFDSGDPNAPDPIDRVSCRPDVAILCYPVISLMPPYGHMGSRDNLLGPNPPQQTVDLLCNDKQVTSKTPPTFLFHTTDDGGVPVENSLLFAMACRKAGVPVEIHSYEHGPHGVGLAEKDSVLNTWTMLCATWLKGRGFAK